MDTDSCQVIAPDFWLKKNKVHNEAEYIGRTKNIDEGTGENSEDWKRTWDTRTIPKKAQKEGVYGTGNKIQV